MLVLILECLFHKRHQKRIDNSIHRHLYKTNKNNNKKMSDKFNGFSQDDINKLKTKPNKENGKLYYFC